MTISGRSRPNLDSAYIILAKKFGESRILAHLYDVKSYDQVVGLWDAAKEKFSRIDIWINNAGTGHPETMIWDYSPDIIDKIVATNITGALYGFKVSLKGMLQQGFGSVYNMEGLGSSGPVIKGLALYAATKSALAYLTTAAAKEVKSTTVIFGGLRPGMVATKLITDQYAGHPEEWQRSERIFNILSDRVETVNPWLAKKVLANKKNGVRISWLTRFKIMMRSLKSPFYKRKVFSSD